VLIRRRPRNTAKPPANIVSPAIAEAGSISGAWTREGEANGMQMGGNQRIWKHSSELPLEADATPAMVINMSAKLIFRITVKSSN
jgi:hypothetical protein